MLIPEDIKERIIRHSEGKLSEIIKHYVPDLNKRGSAKDATGTCPSCQKAKKLTVNDTKNIYKCFSCDVAGKGAVDYLIKVEGFTYPDALTHLAEKFGIILPDEMPAVEKKQIKLKDKTEAAKTVTIKDKKIEKKEKSTKKTFCDLQLEASGLTVEDITANVSIDNDTLREMPAFIPGTRDQYGKLLEYQGDDMIVRYFDLYGKPVTYRRETEKTDREFCRVRWQFPEQHPDVKGNPMKYASPKDSGVHIYIPEKIRAMFRNHRKITTLFLQEGEKKAEKSCKHDILSIGIAGIHNLAGKGKSQLPYEVQLIVKECEVENVVFMLDADFDDLSDKLTPEINAQYRPYTFFSAVKNFKAYFKTFINQGINLEIYFAHINKNEANDKGIDDLLVNTMKDKEAELKLEVDRLLNEKNPEGKYITLHRISSYSDQKLENIWALDTAENFARRHKSKLEHLPEFTIGRHRWRFKEGVFESAQPLEEDEKFWEETEFKGQTNYNFCYVNAITFLGRRGFGRRLTPNRKDYVMIRNVNNVISLQEVHNARDFIYEFTKQLGLKKVMELLIKGGPQYLGANTLSFLDYANIEFEKPNKNFQKLYFNNTCWKISADNWESIPITQLSYPVWQDHILPHKVEKLQDPLFEATLVTQELLNSLKPEERQKMQRHEGRWFIDFSDEGRKCDFLRFFENTSNFTWRKELLAESDESQIPTEEELFENNHHFIAKLCAFGYLCHQYKDPTKSRAVVGMDGKQSEIGASNGRSGKSLFGKALSQVVPQVYIPGKSKNLTDDPFLFDGIEERTRSIFFDDIRQNLDFEFFFPLITGDLTINRKGGIRFSIAFEQSPKPYFSTNHAINGEGSSYTDRQWIIAFSDFYNDEHHPIDDFGQPFFTDWDYEQWNLFYNFVGCCIKTYLKFGVVQSPSEKIEIRRLRQIMGESFLMWADEFYSDPNKMNIKITRKELWDGFIAKFPTQSKFCSATAFKNKIKAYCTYKHYFFNPHLYDAKGLPLKYDKQGQPITDDKSGGQEYFVVADRQNIAL
jgi:hypothetical protein